ncbi:MAG: hypothetical protein A2315_07285 [Ignavibacteria bacterium RIFOXYB2_FULL_35_12]|nr:MAG: hypothetical protein A2058_06045 [Ignavibacteria bacterium GWA2_36_19]OGU52152.1 MAG: hypothetical protein A2006_00510 [Ignavibacteria bacterium GWC2_35_8]OGU57181.1 MAG: hypothetical protein A2X60_12985 [Ignavibacteria bacterium GWF2_35_20]OGU81900.1 MAG: hypothetical protein A2254_01060 [Ignavibacteria bacterium RIFOXYA2_FULL_35_9]OGU90811.1 MAG: hypothetical protein A3K31_12295 [Ignavibacteria bacterium RIFOXYA12_FULL_35_25]OGU91487.1 MAG: hypothetical protein A2492_02525 [Ignavibac
MIKGNHFLILLTTTLVYGIVWALVFLFFSSFHGMTKMFNEDFIFFIARIFNTKLSTVTTGFTFAFFDGALIGFLLGSIFMRIYKRNENK